MRRFRLLHVTIVALLALAAVAGLVQPTAAAPNVAVSANSATPNFPTDITFSLTASAAADITRVELLYTTAGQKTFNLVTPAFSPGPSVEVSHRLDMGLNYLPPGIDVAYRWRLTDTDGTITETEPQTFLWADTRFDWQTVETEQVKVYAYNGNEDFNREILDSAQRTIDKLQTDFKVERSKPLRIWVYDSRNDFGGAQAPNSEPWIAGTSYPGLYLILAVLPEGNRAEIGRVIPHEVSHQVLFQVTENPFNTAPTWLDEGLAVYNQEGGTEDFPVLVEDAAEQGRLFSIRALNSDFPYDPADATLAYAESLSIVNFIIDQLGADKMAALIAVFHQGVSYDEAVQSALGISLDELDRQWKASLGYAGDRPAGSGSTRDSGGVGSPGGLSDRGAGLLASGVIVMAAASLLAIATGAVAVRRSRRRIAELAD